MRTSKFSPRIRGELEGGKIKPVSFSTKASGIVKYLEKPYSSYGQFKTNTNVFSAKTEGLSPRFYTDLFCVLH